MDWTLPVPAAFIIGTDGRIAFSHVDPDYKRRIDGAALLQAARLALEAGRAAPDTKGEP